MTVSPGRAPATGVDHVIAGSGYEATIASVGASLRTLRHVGRDLIAPFGTGAPRPAMRGAVLAPWPNRLADGRYSFGGEEHQLPLSEPETRNAAHGLLAWQHFSVLEEAADVVRLSSRVEAQPGYPWSVRVDVEFEVGADGLRQRVSAVNEGTEAAPIGLGAHPYLLAGAGAATGGADRRADAGSPPLDGWSLHLPASSVLTTDDRLLPVGRERVEEFEGGELDFRRPRVIGGVVLNHAFGDLGETAGPSALGPERGPVVVRLVDAVGVGVELTVDSSTPWLQLYSADALPGRARRAALAVEPMTCPPDAFNSGIDLRILPPGGRTSMEFTLRALG